MNKIIFGVVCFSLGTAVGFYGAKAAYEKTLNDEAEELRKLYREKIMKDYKEDIDEDPEEISGDSIYIKPNTSKTDYTHPFMNKPSLDDVYEEIIDVENQESDKISEDQTLPFEEINYELFSSVWSRMGSMTNNQIEDTVLIDIYYDLQSGEFSDGQENLTAVIKDMIGEKFYNQFMSNNEESIDVYNKEHATVYSVYPYNKPEETVDNLEPLDDKAYYPLSPRERREKNV
jgi:hypothetical protein